MTHMHNPAHPGEASRHDSPRGLEPAPTCGSRYLRELLIEAARAMLSAEASASILSVGLNVGSTSRSNFYEAFREIEGMTPGSYRKRHSLARNRE